MALRVNIQKLVNKAITRQLGDLAEACTYTSLSSVYDAGESATVETATATASIVAVFASKTDMLERLSSLIRQQQDETVEGVLPTLRAIVDSLQLTNAGITPKVNDMITKSGTTYTVSGVKIDPAGAAYILTLREP